MWYYFLRYAAAAYLKLFHRITVHGAENLPRKTNFIIIANHVSFLDPLVVMAAVPRKIYCIAMRDIYKLHWLRWFLKVTDAVPSGNASSKAIALLEKNRTVGLFPEGGISRDGKLKDFRRGTALLAFRTGRPVVPCAITGSFDALPFGKRIPRPVRIRIRIGKPVFFLKELEEFLDDVQLQHGTLRLQTEVKKLFDAG